MSKKTMMAPTVISHNKYSNFDVIIEFRNRGGFTLLSQTNVM